MSLEKVYDYFRNYDSETYQVFACGGEAPSEEDIKSFENQYNIKLPKDFREFTMSALGGLYMEVREEIWPAARYMMSLHSGNSAVELWSMAYQKIFLNILIFV